ncbi:MAG: DUF1998 domain-containing protein, partial [Chloroflexi bacterium]|nr:DUF1998 domain-containing protein [Chloroflexota bacterium]
IPEGIGLSGRLYELHAELLRGAAELVCGCPCAEGCPACVGAVSVNGEETKALTARLTQALTRQL